MKLRESNMYDIFENVVENVSFFICWIILLTTDIIIIIKLTLLTSKIKETYRRGETLSMIKLTWLLRDAWNYYGWNYVTCVIFHLIVIGIIKNWLCKFYEYQIGNYFTSTLIYVLRTCFMELDLNLNSNIKILYECPPLRNMRVYLLKGTY